MVRLGKQSPDKWENSFSLATGEISTGEVETRKKTDSDRIGSRGGAPGLSWRIWGSRRGIVSQRNTTGSEGKIGRQVHWNGNKGGRDR